MATLPSVEQREQSPRAPVEIEVPASTAWPLVLAFGFTLMFAGLLTSVSVSVLGVVLAVAGCVGWFREVFPHEHEETVPVVFEEHRITTERRVVERVPIAPELVRAWLPLEDLPDIGRHKGWPRGRQSRWPCWPVPTGCSKPEASGIPSTSLPLLSMRESLKPRPRPTEFVSCGQFRDCRGPARHRIHLRGTALWRDASHVRAAADRTRRADCPSAVVGASVLDHAASQSFACQPHRLVLVYGVADRLRRRSGPRRRAPGTRLDSRESAVRRARGN